MAKSHTRRFLFRLLAIGLLGWGLVGAAQEVNTFERTGVIQELDPIDEQIVIDGRSYSLPTAVYRQATDQHGERITLQEGMWVSFYGSVAGDTYQIEGISFLRWSDQ